MQCKYCGADLQEGDSFCMNCGKSCDMVTPITLEENVLMGNLQTPQNAPIQPMNNQNNNNKKMFLIIGLIVVMAVVSIGVVLFIDSRNVASSSTTSNSKPSNTNSNSDTNIDTNTNSNSNFNDNITVVSGGEATFNNYVFDVPINFEVEVEHWEYLGDYMTITNKDNKNTYDIEIESNSYSTFKEKGDAIKEELSFDGVYIVGDIQYKTYNGKEYMIVSSKFGESSTIYHMYAYVALNENETLFIEGTREDYQEDYEIFSDIASIIASAHQ